MMTPLHMACTHGSECIAKYLIEKGAALRANDEESGTPLHAACNDGHIEIVKLLFDAGEQQGLLPQVSDGLPGRYSATCIYTKGLFAHAIVSPWTKLISDYR